MPDINSAFEVGFKPHLDKQLKNPRERNGLFIVGAPGAGKTTLLNCIGEVYPEFFPDRSVIDSDQASAEFLDQLDQVFGGARYDSRERKIRPVVDKIKVQKYILGHSYTESIMEGSFLWEIHPHFDIPDLIKEAKDHGVTNIGMIWLITDKVDTNLKRVDKRDYKHPPLPTVMDVDGERIEMSDVNRDLNVTIGIERLIKDYDQTGRVRLPRVLKKANFDYGMVVDTSKENRFDVCAIFEKGQERPTILHMPEYAKRQIFPQRSLAETSLKAGLVPWDAVREGITVHNSRLDLDKLFEKDR